MIRTFIAVVALLLSTFIATPAAASADVVEQPNIVFITVDDMTEYDLEWMPYTKQLFETNGVVVDGFISPHPLCCPARAEMLTGQYAQNNGVRHNSGPNGGFQALRGGPLLPDILQDAGYSNAFVGKYLNQYDSSNSPETGWDIWNPFIEGVYRKTNFVTELEGQVSGPHTTNFTGSKTEEYITQLSANPEPFFVWSSFIAPHRFRYDSSDPFQPPIPPEPYRDLFSNVTPPSMLKPSFNEENVSDKPNSIKNNEKVDPADIKFEFRQRIRSVNAVDDRVQGIVEALTQAGELDNTIIAFTSDNGYLLGEHRAVLKNMPYEEALQVPFLISGPGIPAGVEREQLTSMIDIFPTFLNLAGLDHTGASIDGHTMLPTLQTGAPGYKRMLIQGGNSDGSWKFQGLTTKNWTWASHADGSFEYYNNNDDPYQLHSIYPPPSGFMDYFLKLKDCSGPECWQYATAQ